MQVVGWIVRTGEPGSVKYWKVGVTDSERAAAMAAEAAGTQTAKAISQIAARATNYPGSNFALNSGSAIEIWEREASFLTHRPAGSNAIGLASSDGLGEITFDTILSDEDNEYVEGCYRTNSGDWRVYAFTHGDHERNSRMSEKDIRHDIVFRGGVIGTDGILPRENKLNKDSIIRILAELTGVEHWVEVSGPNSLILK